MKGHQYIESLGDNFDPDSICQIELTEEVLNLLDESLSPRFYGSNDRLYKFNSQNKIAAPLIDTE